MEAFVLMKPTVIVEADSNVNVLKISVPVIEKLSPVKSTTIVVEGIGGVGGT